MLRNVFYQVILCLHRQGALSILDTFLCVLHICCCLLSGVTDRLGEKEEMTMKGAAVSRGSIMQRR